MYAPLDDVRVLDLSRLYPGPYATLLLSDLGAEVIKIEDPKGGDYIRHYPPACADGNSAMFHALNRGKKSVSLDLRDAEDRGRLERLLETSDVVVESFRPGVLEKLGLSPERLLEKYPKLIVCRISGYGQDGPWAQRAGHDLNYAARAGVLGTMSAPGVLPVQIADLAGGAWPAAVQILAALIGRSKSGEGRIIDVNMTEGARAMLALPLARHAVSGEQIKDRDLLAGNVPSYDVYKTKDGHLAVGALEPKFWSAFCGGIERPDLVSEGLTHGDAGHRIRAEVQARLMERTADEWMAHLGPLDCCVEKVEAPEALPGDLHPWLEVDVEGEAVRVPSPGLDLERRPTSAGPGLGADNAALLGE